MKDFYKMIEEYPISWNPMVVVKWIENLKRTEDEEIRIKGMQRREWVIMRPDELEDDGPGVLLLTNHEVIMSFDDMETDGSRLIFFLRGLEICSMYPMIGWVARRVMV